MSISILSPIQQINQSQVAGKRNNIVFALPMYGGVCYESCLLSFIEWSNFAQQNKLDWSIITLSNESLIPRARNTLVSKFMVDHPDATHLMFIDADIGWRPEHVMALLSRNCDIIGGLYPLKSLPIRWCCNGLEGAVSKEGLEEVTKTGTGFLLIKREVFDQLKVLPAVEQYTNDIGLNVQYDRELYTYFDTVVREGRYLSEDWKFCDDWRQLGNQVFVDKNVLLRHSGTYVFCQEEQTALIKLLGLEFMQTIQKDFNLRLVDSQGYQVQLTP